LITIYICTTSDTSKSAPSSRCVSSTCECIDFENYPNFRSAFSHTASPGASFLARLGARGPNRKVAARSAQSCKRLYYLLRESTVPDCTACLRVGPMGTPLVTVLHQHTLFSRARRQQLSGHATVRDRLALPAAHEGRRGDRPLTAEALPRAPAHRWIIS
jgi:hypothetical protein